MTFSPSPSITERRRILVLLASIIVLALGILGLSASLFCGGFYHTGVFLAAEGALVLLPTVQIFLRYGYHQFRMQGRGAVKWKTGRICTNILASASTWVIVIKNSFCSLLNRFPVFCRQIVGGPRSSHAYDVARLQPQRFKSGDRRTDPKSLRGDFPKVSLPKFTSGYEFMRWRY